MGSIARVASFYSGAGGLDLGFLRAGYSIQFANDIDAIAMQTHLANHQVENFYVGDVTKLDITPALGADVVIGGPPCQGFSVAGKMDPGDPRSQHVWNFLGLVSKIKPKVFVMENVKNLYTNARWASLRDGLVVAANQMGYSTSLQVLNAADFSTPQARERMFLIGVRGIAQVPSLKPTAVSKRVTVREALQLLPRYGMKRNNTFCSAKITAAAKPVLRRSPYAGMLFNGAGRPLDLERPATTLPASMGGNRTPILEQNLLDGDSRSWVHWYHQHLMAGGSPIPFSQPVGGDLRRLTVEEAAVLQGFPPGMEFSGPPSAQFRQIGNSVAPPMAEAVAKHTWSLLEIADANSPIRDFGAEELSLIGATSSSLFELDQAV